MCPDQIKASDRSATMTRIRRECFLLLVFTLYAFGVSAQDAVATNEKNAQFEDSTFLRSLAFITCDLNEQHWKILRLYFARVPTVEVTDVVNINGKVTRFSFKTVKQLTANSSTVVRVYQYVVANKIIGTQDSTLSNTSMPKVRQVFNYRAPNRRNFIRRDESSFGSLIYTDDLSGLRKLIDGPVQHPFENPDGHFFIVLTSRTLPTDWQDVAAVLLEMLWIKWFIMYAVILSSCDPKQQIGFYQPFVLDERTMRWGVVRWSNIDDIDEEHFWILSYTTNWQKYPIKTGLFRRYPTLILNNEVPEKYLKSYFLSVSEHAANFTGFDGVILGNMAKLQNFTVQPVFNTNLYGTKLPNGTFTGVIGDLLNHAADIAINSRFVIDYETQQIDFLNQIFADKFCVIAPAAAARPHWTAMFRCFSLFSWMLIVTVQVLSVVVWMVFRQSTMDSCRNARKLSVSESVFEMYKVFISYPAKIHVRVPNPELIFVTSCLLTNIIIVGAFRGSFTNTMWTVAYEPEIDTMQKLYDSQLPIARSSVKNIFGDQSDTPLMRLLQSRQVDFVTNVSSMDYVAFQRTMCTIQRFLDINIVIQIKYLDHYGRPLVHIVKECPRSYLLAYIIKKGSPFKTRLNRILDQFFEAGFLSKWYNNIEMVLIAAKKTDKKVAESTEHALTLIDMQTSFYILFIGLLMSLIVFVAEIWWHYYREKFSWTKMLSSIYFNKLHIRRKNSLCLNCKRQNNHGLKIDQIGHTHFSF